MTKAEALMAEQGLEPVRIFRDGPRYWAGMVRRGNERLVLKLVLDDTPWLSPGTARQFRPSDQLRTEIEVVRTLWSERSRLAGQSAQLAAFSLDDEPWMLRHALEGENAAEADSPLFFRPEFFEGQAGRSTWDYIDSYQVLTPTLRKLLERSPHTAQTALVSRMVWANLGQPTELLAPYVASIRDFLLEHRELHDSRRNTLAHTQVFPVHIFLSLGGEAGLIDWENACLSNELGDYVSLWIRGLEHEAWQQGLVSWLENSGRLVSSADREMWKVEVLLQAMNNLNYAFWSRKEGQSQRERAMDLLTNCIQAVLG